MAKRPRLEIQSVIIYRKDKHDNWKPHKVEKNSWVTLNAPKRGPWAKESNLKAQVKGFKFKPNSTVVESILVAHAYSFRQLQVDTKAGPQKLIGEVNYLYPSKCQDWEDPQALANVIVVTHAIIGELKRGTRTHKQLEEAGIFFVNASYTPPSARGKFGKFTPIPLPALDDESWPVPDMNTSEAFRDRLFSDFQLAMKSKIGSKVTNVHWFIPLHVVLDLFCVQCESGVRRTPQMWVWEKISEEQFDSLMDDHWDSKIVVGEDIIKCQVVCSSVCFRYHIARQTLYTRFKYVREILDKDKWKPLDQIADVEMISIHIDLLDGSRQTFEVGKTWTVRDLRAEINFYMNTAEETEGFSFMIINSTNGRVKKINRRQERTLAIGDLGSTSFRLKQS